MIMTTGIFLLILGVVGMAVSIMLLITVRHSLSQKIKEQVNRVWSEYR